jgi:hypothetical protein
MSHTSAAVAMSVYIAAPYHLLDQYQRGATAELMGFVWMPLILFFVTRLIGDARATATRVAASIQGRPPAWDFASIAGLALSYGAFLWSHPPTAFQFTLILAVLVPLISLMGGDWKGALSAGAGGILGMGVAAAYLLPAVVEQDLIRYEYLGENWPYHESYVFARTAYANAHRAFFDRIDHIWILSAGAILITSLAIGLTLRKRVVARPLARSVLAWTVAGLVALFMMTQISEPVGHLIPRIEIGVFSWRMLAITTLMASLLAGACAESCIGAWKQRSTLSSFPSTVFAIIVVTIVTVFAGFSVARVAIRWRMSRSSNLRASI